MMPTNKFFPIRLFVTITVAAFFCLGASTRAGILAQFKMMDKLGTIDVELFEQDKPVTVSNFIAYVKSDAWHDEFFQRWIPGFILQGGSFKVTHRDDLMTLWNTNPDSVTAFPPIPFEENVGHFYSNTYGTIAMARIGTDTNSAATDWFFNLANNTNLDTQDGGYTVFGRTLRGTNMFNFFIPPSGTGPIFNIFGTDIPVFTDDPNRVNIYYVTSDITLLTVQIALTRLGRQISWNSVAGLPNIVEFARTVPAVWEPLQTVTGTGATMSIVDSSADDQMRQYRVRIDYSN